MSELKEKSAYLAMFNFLEQYYVRTQDPSIGGLLGEISLLPDGSPADPAVISDWNEAVAKSIEGTVNASLSIEI
jgi:hypothetical protein